jgi:hypothetical protein
MPRRPSSNSVWAFSKGFSLAFNGAISPDVGFYVGFYGFLVFTSFSVIVSEIFKKMDLKLLL